MMPDTWLAWFIFEGGSHPLFFRFIGLLRTGESSLAKLEMENGAELLLPEKTLAKLVVTTRPTFSRPERGYLPTQYNSRTPGGEEVGNVVPTDPARQSVRAMAAAMGIFSNRSI